MYNVSSSLLADFSHAFKSNKFVSRIIAQIARKALAKQGWNELHMVSSRIFLF